MLGDLVLLIYSNSRFKTQYKNVYLVIKDQR
jgi:hypothetical protein